MIQRVRLLKSTVLKVYHIGRIVCEPGTVFTFDTTRQPHNLKYTFLYWGPHKVTLKTSRFNQTNFEFVGDNDETS